MDIQQLRKILQLVWCAETAKGNWTPDCPSMNQCAVTALIVQDYFGGELLRCPMANSDSHYWNRLSDGTEIDLTSDQFAYLKEEPLKENFVVRTREYTLSFPDTLKRYKLLKHRVEQELHRLDL